ncbi:hypothetical protein Ccrd_013085 [Cynara cardunculus var. scolymus]|uniref:DUF7026 domain-containing protein n=1 Tax=Cynara cardunculus var. scolymus TaxID=59895 RepID=A0A103YG84_CYNCS|nr:hypothetical protein Ccrd_013085 [Cynara cardunculus var. scolymus]
MALIRVHLHLNLLPPHHLLQFTKFQTHPFLHCPNTPPKLQISCSSSSSNSNSSSIVDIELVMDLATEIEKMNAQTVQTQEAMKASRKLLYAELGLYLGLGKEELRRKWEKMEQDEKWILAEEFVSD